VDEEENASKPVCIKSYTKSMGFCQFKWYCNMLKLKAIRGSGRMLERVARCRITFINHNNITSFVYLIFV
jgi:hypothetical protein